MSIHSISRHVRYERTTCDDGVPEVDPEDVLLISILLEDRLEALLETINRGLACAENGEARKLVKGQLVLNRIVFTQPSKILEKN